MPRARAHLGLATSEELIRELIARAMPERPDQALILAEMLGAMGPAEREYRTVEP